MKNTMSPLKKTASITDTDYWNDSCALTEMQYALANGAVGATTNPVIVQTVLSQEAETWSKIIKSLIDENPKNTEEETAWKIMTTILIERSKLLYKIFEDSAGKNGRIAIQVSAKQYKDADYMVDQAKYFQSLAPNIIVKIPATAAGIHAMKTATIEGVSVLATVNFTAAQSIAIAEAIEEGLRMRKKPESKTQEQTSICALMVGRLDDWLKIIVNKDNVITDPGFIEWAGVAVFKRVYKIFKKNGYATRLMSAAYRNHFHWSQFIGGDVVLTIPHSWQLRFNSSDVPVENRMNVPVNPIIIEELENKFTEFKKAYEPNGLAIDDFDSYGAVARTLRSFIAGYDNFLYMIRDIMIPNPDL